MTESSNKASPKELFGNKKHQTADPLDELRRLLFRQEQTQIDQLEERLDTREVRAKELSQVLPEAILIRTSHDKQLAKALEPTIEEAIKACVNRDRRILVDALFPVMGPAIRKAISSAILGMIQSFNQVLEYSFSIQGLKWRLEALKTKKPFGEVVLLHALVYHVEQVFLIHRDTGLLLQHVVAKEVTAQDPDLVSGMLTAIQDFVRDSFGVEKDETLETFRVGDRTVWVEQGPHALIAAVVRGNPPLGFQGVLHEALETIHLKQMEAFEHFVGDTSPFEATERPLGDCLQSQYKREKQKTSFLLWLILCVVILLIGGWTFYFFQDYKQWAHYLQELDGRPGIVVTSIEKRYGKHYISGLRDPLASDPVEMLKEAKLEPEEAVFQWEPYHALYPQFMIIRIKDVLRPPDTIRLELTNAVLHAYGSASHEWIDKSRELAETIPWITNYQEHDLIDIDLAEIKIIAKEIEKQSLLFESDKTSIAPDQEDTVRGLISDIQKLAYFAHALGQARRR